MKSIAIDPRARGAALSLVIVLTVCARPVLAEDVPVPGGLEVVAGMLGVRPTPDAARFVSEAVRVLYTLPPGRDAEARQGIERFHRAAPTLDRTGDVVPIPLTTAFWSRVIFDRPVSPDMLLAEILADRAAALLCYGLAGLDDETLAYVEAHPTLVARMYRRAGVFAAFAGSIHVHDGRIAAPGGASAAPLWEAATNRSLGDPESFLSAWLDTGEGHVAYLYDIVSALDRSRAAFVTGAWIAGAEDRVARFKALVDAVDMSVPEWDIGRVPFARPQYDVAALLWRVRTLEDGEPAPPASRELWGPAFDSDRLSADVGRLATATPIDAAWLVQAMLQYDGRRRSWRFAQLTFGQRAFASVPAEDWPAAQVALRGYLRFPELMLEIERIGVRSPRVYAAAARRAATFDGLDATRAFAALGQFQGALALVSHLVRVRSLDRNGAAALVSDLIARDLTSDGWYDGAVAEWIADVLAPKLKPDYDTEHTLLDALGGLATPDGAEHTVVWEGQRYRLDLGAAEKRRLERVREKQGVEPIDVPLAVAVIARRLASLPTGEPRVAGTAADLHHLAEELRRNLSRAITPDRVNLPDVVVILDESARSLSDTRPKDVTRVAADVSRVGDVLVAQSLISLAYAIYIGDPDGTVLLAGDVSRRHNFGFASHEPDGWSRVAWSAPRAKVAPGEPWHVDGSLLGLDVGLASLALRRINTDRVVPAPTITMNERDSFTAAVALMDPLALTDGDRDRIAAGVARGWARVEALTGPGPALDDVADAIGLDGWRRRAAGWMLTHEPGAVATLFSLGEFLELGGGPQAGLDAWGGSGLPADDCLCLEFVPARQWYLRRGRPPLGLLATVVVDLTLHIAMALGELRLPAALSQDVLRSATQDFIDEVRPTDPDDWLSLVRAARSAPRERIEDYIAASAAIGPLVPAEP